VELIKIHGKYHEFLDFYDTILDTAEKLSTNNDLHKIVLHNLFDFDNFEELDVSNYGIN
jgi:hypothetical protein